MELLRQLDDKQTDKQTDKQMDLQSYSLSRYRNWKSSVHKFFCFLVNFIRHIGPMVTLRQQVHGWAISASSGQSELGKNLRKNLVSTTIFIVNFISHIGPIVTLLHQGHMWAISASIGSNELRFSAQFCQISWFHFFSLSETQTTINNSFSTRAWL